MLATPHKKNYSQLVNMSMKALLKLVQDHNLSHLLGVYRRMNKTSLVNALRKYEKSTVNSTPTVKQRSAKPARKKPKAPSPNITNKAPKKPKATSPNITNKAPKKRITPTLVKSTSAEPFQSKGTKGEMTYSKTVRNIEKKAAAMDASKKGKKLISNTPVRKSARIQTINNYKTGKSY